MSWQPSTYAILEGDARTALAEVAPGSVQCVITSPPFLGKRAYGTTAQLWGGDPTCAHQWVSVKSPGHRSSDSHPGPVQTTYNSQRELLRGQRCTRCDAWLGELGHEETPASYAAHLVEVFREIRRVLAKDGTVWLNLGDTRSSGDRSTFGKPGSSAKNVAVKGAPRPPTPPDCKDKDLLLVPFEVARALRSDGWYLRSDIAWIKPSPKPESMKDRPTDGHEHLFLLSRSKRYYFNAEPLRGPSGRNGLDYWVIKPEPSRVPHQAPFPAALARLPILAGSRPGDLVLDPFSGVSTAGEVALVEGRRYLGVELHHATVVQSQDRLALVAAALRAEEEEVA